MLGNTAHTLIYISPMAQTKGKRRNAPHMPLLIVVALAATPFVLCCSCDDKPEGFAETEISRETSLAADGHSPQCKVIMSVAYAASGNAARDKRINSTIVRRLFGANTDNVAKAAEKFADNYAAEYQRSLSPLYATDKDDKGKQAWYEYDYRLQTTTRLGPRGIVAYTATATWHEGGGQTTTQTLALNFDQATGRTIAMGDVFVAGAEKRLEELLLDRLKDHAGATDDDELKAKGYLNATTMYATSNFSLGKRGVTFIYNTSEIAMRDNGQVELTIGYSAAKPLMRKDFANKHAK